MACLPTNKHLKIAQESGVRRAKGKWAVSIFFEDRLLLGKTRKLNFVLPRGIQDSFSLNGPLLPYQMAITTHSLVTIIASSVASRTDIVPPSQERLGA